MPTPGGPSSKTLSVSAINPAGRKILDDFGIDRGLKFEVEALERFLEREAGHGGFHGRVPLVLRGDLAAEDLFEEVAVCEVFLARFLKEGGQVVDEPEQPKALHLLLDSLDLSGEHRH